MNKAIVLQHGAKMSGANVCRVSCLSQIHADPHNGLDEPQKQSTEVVGIECFAWPRQ